MQNPNPSPPENQRPTASDLFRSNQTLNVESLTPTLGWPTVASYRPSGKVGPLGWPLLLLSLFLVPLVSGFLYEKLWHFGEFLIFSSIALGALVGALLFLPVHFGKVRNPLLAAILGCIIGAATFGTSMFLQAQQHRDTYIAYETEYLVKTKGVKPQQARDAVTKFYTPLNMTRYYWQDRAQAGVTLTSSRRRGQSQLSGGMFWALEGLEFFLVALCGGFLARYAAKRRFSEDTTEWFTTKAVYGISPLYVGPFMQSLDENDFDKARRIAATTAGQQVGAQAVVSYLKEKSGGILTIKARTHKNKEMQPIWERELSNTELKTFWSEFPMPNQTENPFGS